VRQLPPDKFGTRRSAARGPWAATGGRVITSKNRAAWQLPNFTAAAERGAGAARDGEGTTGCARFRLASLTHAARPYALPVGRARPSTSPRLVARAGRGSALTHKGTAAVVSRRDARLGHGLP
jgi:hypothetical protein